MADRLSSSLALRVVLLCRAVASRCTVPVASAAAVLTRACLQVLFTDGRSHAAEKKIAIREKFYIVDRLEKGASNGDMSGLSSTVSTIWKSRETIKKSFETDHTKQKRLRGTQFEDVEEALLTWFKIQRSNNVPINGPLLVEKAQQFASSLGHESKPDSSWIQRFRLRHNIVFGKISSESSSAPTESKDDCLETVWPKIRDGYADDDIYNADETGLFYRMSPDKTFNFKGE